MLIEAIRLMNFMSFEDTGWIDLKPVTLLFGRNSSGKSAVIRALRFLRQSLQDSNAQIANHPFVFRSEHGVDVGNFREMVHKHDTDSIIFFGFRFGIPPDSGILNDYFPESINKITMVEIVLGFGWIDENVRLMFLEINNIETSQPATIFGAELINETTEGSDDQPENWYFWSEIFDPKTDFELYGFNIWDSVTIGQLNGFLPRINIRHFVQEDFGKEYHMVDRFLKLFRDSVDIFLRKLTVMPPIRPIPERFYQIDTAKKQLWSEKGLQPFMKLLADDLSPDEKHLISYWLQQFNLGNELTINKWGPPGFDGMMSEIRLKESKEGLDVNIVDAGFGISQVLPILVQCICADKDSLVIVEQPELHLHPKAQAVLSDLFISLVNRKNIRFLIETHSENIQLRFRRRLAETIGNIEIDEQLMIRVEGFQSYFVDRQNGLSTIEKLTFDKWGDFINRPKGYADFFGQDFEELAKMKLARYKS